MLHKILIYYNDGDNDNNSSDSRHFSGKNCNNTYIGTSKLTTIILILIKANVYS